MALIIIRFRRTWYETGANSFVSGEPGTKKRQKAQEYKANLVRKNGVMIEMRHCQDKVIRLILKSV